MKDAGQEAASFSCVQFGILVFLPEVSYGEQAGKGGIRGNVRGIGCKILPRDAGVVYWRGMETRNVLSVRAIMAALAMACGAASAAQDSDFAALKAQPAIC